MGSPSEPQESSAEPDDKMAERTTEEVIDDQVATVDPAKIELTVH